MDAYSSTFRSSFKPGAGYNRVAEAPSQSTSPTRSPVPGQYTPEAKTNLRRIHEESAESSVVISTPDENFHRKEQIALQRQQTKMKEIDKASQLTPRTSQRQGMTRDGEPIRSNRSTDTDSSEVVQQDEVSSSLDALAHARKALFELQTERKALAKRTSGIDGAGSDEESTSCHESSLRELDEQIATTTTLIQRLEALKTHADGTDTQRAGHHNLSSLVRTVTRHRLDRMGAREPTPRLLRNDTLANLRIVHERGQNLALRLPEDRMTGNADDVSANDSPRIEALRAKMEEHAARGDEAFTRYRKLSHAILNDTNNREVGPQTLAAKKKRLQQHEAEWLWHMSQLMPLLNEWEALVGPDSVEVKSAQQLASERKAVVERCKSLQTVALEENYTAKLANQQKRVGDTNAYVLTWDALTGVTAFSSSFLIGNTLGRYLPQPAARYVPPIVSGLLHTIAATPIAKNLLARTWTASSLAELNNYFKLAGAHLGAWIGGTTEQRKYDPKDPAQVGKLTIAEKRQEENKSFHELSRNRYQDEEAAYWCYTLNYSIKAAACAVAAQFLSQGTEAARGIEAGLHAWSGALSGAEYIMTQQQLRSARPNAKPVAVPTREIYAAQAAYLKSLRDDLTTVLAGTRTVTGMDLTDTNMRVLRREGHRLEQERLIAEQKSEWAGIARHEFIAQFQGDAKWDTLSEALGRIITLIPVTAVNEWAAHMRKSPDPLTMFLGHFLPSVVLIAGFTTRPWVCGAIRAGIQAFMTSREQPNAQPDQTVATAVPRDMVQTSASSEAAKSDDALTARTSSESDLVSASSHRGKNTHPTRE